MRRLKPDSRVTPGLSRRNEKETRTAAKNAAGRSGAPRKKAGTAEAARAMAKNESVSPGIRLPPRMTGKFRRQPLCSKFNDLMVGPEGQAKPPYFKGLRCLALKKPSKAFQGFMRGAV